MFVLCAQLLRIDNLRGRIASLASFSLLIWKDISMKIKLAQNGELIDEWDEGWWVKIP